MPAGNGGRPTVRSRQVSAELKRRRKEAGLTTGEVGKRLGVSQSKVSRIENGQLGLQVEEVAALLGLYHVPQQRRDEVLDLVRSAAEPGWVRAHHSGLPAQWQDLIELEGTTSALANFQPLTIPGLLQTAEYARTIIRDASETTLSESELDTMVAARLGRQTVLSRAWPPSLHAVLYEPALRVPVGGQEVLPAQLRHLVEMAKRPRVTVQVVPLAAGPHPGLEGPFMIMEFESDPPLVHLENRARSTFLEEASHVESYRLAWERIRAKALPPARSAELITEFARHAAQAERP
ncbi:helix-turn-helix transcriptional regulator [Haloechinothrix sp. LS1_15]|uniref:helix-turn-helix domain-containing protein n=1 Tax=Haloechinothrix sp. LS1_15 TaxID=2652248 RepID=UPI002945B21C|nr:helix-turn-helix transcriptional regulator [Haloechinothrix sp. LS1_15]MDV6010893.1 helix-turn-helix domain-containing protein [Haloechinothrix sp. LS1_15]